MESVTWKYCPHGLGGRMGVLRCFSLRCSGLQRVPRLPDPPPTPNPGQASLQPFPVLRPRCSANARLPSAPKHREHEEPGVQGLCLAAPRPSELGSPAVVVQWRRKGGCCGHVGLLCMGLPRERGTSPVAPTSSPGLPGEDTRFGKGYGAF